MAAGQGFKTFTTGEVLTAGDVNGYLMQGVLVFASTAARDAAITSPAEGQFAFTKDTNSLFYYDGAAWVASGATGDIEGVTAGIGISGGGTSGTVTVTNSMATAIDAKGDLVAGTGADTFAKLTVGANDTVLTADSTAATGLKWATPSSGAMTLLSTTTLSGVTTTISGISQSYNYLHIVIFGLTTTTGTANPRLAPNASTSLAAQVAVMMSGGSAAADTLNASYLQMANFSGSNKPRGSSSSNIYTAQIYNYTSATARKSFAVQSGFVDDFSGAFRAYNGAGGLDTTSAITSFAVSADGNSVSAGTMLIYGVK
jgi:hypothetical protein